MSSAHLSQTISQLSAQQQVAYASPTPHAPHTRTYQKNIQHWSAASTPQPMKQSVSKSTRSLRASKTPLAYGTPPIQRQESVSYYQQPVAQHHPYPAPIQNPPRPILPPSRQALETSYPSRLRTGATLLVQPILANLPVATGPVASTSTALGARTSGRRGTAVNYVEPGSGDDLPDAGAIDSDDSDFIASGGTRTALRQTGRGGRYVTNGTTVFNANAAGQPAGKAELDQSYLGLVPPVRFIKSQPAKPTLHEYPSEDDLARHATLPSALIPIRVEFETDTLRVRDCFVWNLHETLIKPESFARTFCNDLDLPSTWAETVANQIRAQIEEHEGVASMDLGNGAEGLTPAPTNVEPLVAQDLEEIDKPTDVEEVPECRVVISIDVQIATHHLLDHIEWDLLSPLTPEDFARQLCAEIGLGGEAVSLISHAIHEEIIKHKKDAVEWGVIGGDREPNRSLLPADSAGGGGVGISAVKDKTGLGLGWGRTPKDGRGPKRLRSIWRDWAEAEEFRTKFEVLTAEEVERREIEKERASRRLRRETSKFQGTRSRRR